MIQVHTRLDVAPGFFIRSTYTQPTLATSCSCLLPNLARGVRSAGPSRFDLTVEPTGVEPVTRQRAVGQEENELTDLHARLEDDRQGAGVEQVQDDAAPAPRRHLRC